MILRVIAILALTTTFISFHAYGGINKIETEALLKSIEKQTATVVVNNREIKIPKDRIKSTAYRTGNKVKITLLPSELFDESDY